MKSKIFKILLRQEGSFYHNWIESFVEDIFEVKLEEVPQIISDSYTGVMESNEELVDRFFKEGVCILDYRSSNQAWCRTSEYLIMASSEEEAREWAISI